MIFFSLFGFFPIYLYEKDERAELNCPRASSLTASASDDAESFHPECIAWKIRIGRNLIKCGSSRMGREREVGSGRREDKVN